ncbi:hypothetical protein CAPTEDRAFT_124556 [Capitella teleta]|uniref:Uncharacterized protein n=1 Tax=Capitella teleta TaxID=283909 RepID=R7TV67_CAPTE|nr:hypothetical protein CAPTEDRAFT_124556 [Capitella teleta]|eukprot:ELT94900.1 hypothetical protein CAPTEDRAFT_124556 [Capitella teleta]
MDPLSLVPSSQNPCLAEYTNLGPDDGQGELDVSGFTADGDTPLHAVILLGDSTDAIVRKIECYSKTDRALLDAQNNRRQTPLQLAVLTNNVPVIRHLVLSGCRLDLQDWNGNSALHMACTGGDCVDRVRALLPPPAHPHLHTNCSPKENPAHLMNFKGETPLHVAASRGHVAILRYLTLGHVGADVNVGDGRSGRTILHHAVEENNSDVVYFIARHARHLKLKVNTRSYDGFTAADLAYDRKRHELYDLLKRVSKDEAMDMEVGS